MNIARPTLLLDEDVCRNNIRRTSEKFSALGIEFRPHFKTHQSHAVGRWFRDYGATKITVSSMAMAEYFSKDGWEDITIAFPVNPNDAKQIGNLASKINLNITVVVSGVISTLAATVNAPLGVYIEIDNGYHRTGVDPADYTTIDKIINEIAATSNLTFLGFLSHAGHSYKCRSREEILQVHGNTLRVMTELGKVYKSRYPGIKLSVGDTPTCSVADAFDGIDEVRPGNLAFYDLTQTQIGSCSIENIAVALVCPVVAIYPERNEIVVHGGAVHLSKDSLVENGMVIYGKVTEWEDGWWKTVLTGMYVKSLSQEHGIISASQEQIKHVSIGDVLPIIPVHSCLTADAMKSYTLRNGSTLSMM